MYDLACLSDPACHFAFDQSAGSVANSMNEKASQVGSLHGGLSVVSLPICLALLCFLPCPLFVCPFCWWLCYPPCLVLTALLS